MQNNALEEQQPRKNCMRMEASTTAQVVESLTLSSFYVQQHSASHEQRKGSTTQLQEPNRRLKNEIQTEDLCPFEGGKENRKGTFLPSTVNSCRPDMAVEPSSLLSFAASLVVQSKGSNTVQLLGSEQEYTMDNGPFLDHQIEAYIQANILQCCLLSRSLPQFLQF
jgi:hypothetical protein